ncbi:MAG: hypothetical protein GY722_11895 [bacterium]|nr:hypothetical protein [bacterium]
MNPDAQNPNSPSLRVADIDIAGITEALDDASGETTWWYDPTSGRTELGLSPWNDYSDEDDDPNERGLVPIEAFGSRDAYNDMARFAQAVSGPRAHERLNRALHGRGAFRRFRDTLYEFPDLVSPWHTYRDACAQIRAVDWLVDGQHITEDDAETERTLRNDTCTEILRTLAGTPDRQIEAADVPQRWDELSAAIDSDHGITITRNGYPWAILTPAPGL